ncbi:MAG: hypothetical protein ACP5OA_04290 [Candidatus Woesearchaeota archaeon]
MWYFLEKKKIQRDQEQFLNSVNNFIKLKYSTFTLPNISVFSNMDVTQNRVFSSLINNLTIIRYTIDEIKNKDVEEIKNMVRTHTDAQSRNYSSYSREIEQQHNTELKSQVYNQIYKQTLDMFLPLNDYLKDTVRELELFVTLQSKVIILIEEIRRVNTVLNDDKLNNSGVIVELGKILENLKIITLDKEKFSKDTYVSEAKVLTYDHLQEFLTSLFGYTQSLIDSFKNIDSAIVNIRTNLTIISGIGKSSLTVYLDATASVTLERIMAQMISEKYVRHLFDEPVVIRYCQMSINATYLKIDSLYKDMVLCLNNGATTQMNLNINSRKMFEELYLMFERQKATFIQVQNVRIKSSYDKIVEPVVRSDINSKIIRCYGQGDYQGIYNVLFSLRPEKLYDYINPILKGALFFQKNNKILFHSVSACPQTSLGAWSTCVKYISPKEYAKRLQDIMTQGLRASTKKDSPFYTQSVEDKPLAELQETYYFAVFPRDPLVAYNDEIWHYGLAAIIFDPHGRYAVHEIDRESWTNKKYSEHIIITNPQYNISPQGFVLILNTSFETVGRGSLAWEGKLPGQNYMFEVAKILKSMGVPFKTI